MAVITRVHGVAKEALLDQDWFVGLPLQLVQVTFPSDMATKLGPDSAFSAAIQALESVGTIVGIGPFITGNTKCTVVFEGDGVAVVAAMDAALDAAGTVDSIDLATATTALVDLADNLSA